MTKTKVTMMRHECNKESEITEMHTDIKWIKKALEGNGKKGLVEQVNDNTTGRIKTETGRIILRYAVGSGWSITIILFVMSLIKQLNI